MKINPTFVLLIACTLTLTACGKAEDAMNDFNNALKPKPNTSATRSCADFSGDYKVGGIATLSIRQTGCDTMAIKQTCTGGFCDAFGIDNMDATLQLNGTPVTIDGNVYRATAGQENLIMTKTFPGGRVITKTFSLSAHPCDPSNPDAGLQATVVDAQGDATVTTCQPWSK